MQTGPGPMPYRGVSVGTQFVQQTQAAYMRRPATSLSRTSAKRRIKVQRTAEGAGPCALGLLRNHQTPLQQQSCFDQTERFYCHLVGTPGVEPQHSAVLLCRTGLFTADSVK